MAGICDAVEVIAAMTGPDRRPGNRTIKRETGEKEEEIELARKVGVLEMVSR